MQIVEYTLDNVIESDEKWYQCVGKKRLKKDWHKQKVRRSEVYSETDNSPFQSAFAVHAQSLNRTENDSKKLRERHTSNFTTENHVRVCCFDKSIWLFVSCNFYSAHGEYGDKAIGALSHLVRAHTNAITFDYADSSTSLGTVRFEHFARIKRATHTRTHTHTFMHSRARFKFLALFHFLRW